MLGQWRRRVDTSARTQAVMRRTGAAAINLATLGQQFSGLALVVGGFYLFDAASFPLAQSTATSCSPGARLAPAGHPPSRWSAGARRTTTRAADHRCTQPARAEKNNVGITALKA